MSNGTAYLESLLYGGTLGERLAALKVLCKHAPKVRRKGTNLHIHTNESFSVFRSPSEAVWQAVREGVAVLGINDHYTVAGIEEFRRACEIARIHATFSMEAVAMDVEAEAAHELTNDPGNPGRTYLCAKGITRIPPADSPAIRALAAMRAELEKRNRVMTAKVQELFRTRLGQDGPSWEDVVGLTPRGNVTERHISQAVLVRLKRLCGGEGSGVRGRGSVSSEQLAVSSEQSAAGGSESSACGLQPTAYSFPDLVARCCGAAPPATADDAALQNFIRAKLLKAGAPCFVAESRDAFLPIEETRELFLAFGAIPTYPVLGNPVTHRERDIHALLDRLEQQRIFALEVIPQRNTRERLAEIMNAAKERWWPVFNGTEHNTPERGPLLAPLSLDPEFLPWFEQSAKILLAHQQLAALVRLRGTPPEQSGFVRADGLPTIADPKERFQHFSRTI